MNFLNKRVAWIRRFFRKRKVKNQNVTIIASNCIGGMVYHDLGLKFNSPFINLWITPKDFIKLLKEFDVYLSTDIEFVETEMEYPVGKVRDVTIYFLHYHSENEARLKWNERLKRINRNNVYVVCTERDGCEYSDMLEFDNLPFKNKVMLTHKCYEDIKFSFYIKGFEDKKEVGDLFAWEDFCSGKRLYDQFDFLRWINLGEYKKLI